MLWGQSGEANISEPESCLNMDHSGCRVVFHSQSLLHCLFPHGCDSERKAWANHARVVGLAE